VAISSKEGLVSSGFFHDSVFDNRLDLIGRMNRHEFRKKVGRKRKRVEEEKNGGRKTITRS
jgi:hypothetical protein